MVMMMIATMMVINNDNDDTYFIHLKYSAKYERIGGS